MAYLARHRLLRVLAVVLAMLNFAQGAVWGILVLYVVAPGPMGLSEVGYGLLLTTNAIGTITGTIVAGTIERRLRKPNLFVVSVIVLAAGNVALASTTNPFVVGRVVATFRMLGWGALPLGALAGGIVGEAFGLTAVFWAAAVMSIVLLPVRFLITDERIAAAEAAAVAERGDA